MDAVANIVSLLVPMILSLTVHEWAHAFSAFKLGDDTAASQGRMTLNPIAHIDPIGTLLLPGLSAVTGGLSLIGWAKPVPVSPYKFSRKTTMRRGMLITALAGPASNLVLALLVSGVVMAVFGTVLDDLVAHGATTSRFWSLVAFSDIGFVTSNEKGLLALGLSKTQAVALMFLAKLVLLNIGLAIFNMIPLPPLDGSRLLPLELQERLSRYTMFVFIGLLVLINTAGGILSIPLVPIVEAMLGFWSLIF
jgi:Zn-dependent protease